MVDVYLWERFSQYIATRFAYLVVQRGSVQAITRISSVPQEYAYLVELAALLPQRVIENLVAQRRLGKQAKPCFATKQMEAALLFIDISGFTASMEMFAQQGSQGIEKFWKMFNAYFCDLLDVIQVLRVLVVDRKLSSSRDTCRFSLDPVN